MTPRLRLLRSDQERLPWPWGTLLAARLAPTNTPLASWRGEAASDNAWSIHEAVLDSPRAVS